MTTHLNISNTTSVGSPKPAPTVFQPVSSGVTMKKTMRIVLSSISLAFVASACDLVPPDPTTSTGSTGDIEASTGDSSSGDSSSTGSPGYVCEDVGATCDLKAPACSPGLDCVAVPDYPTKGVCAQRCNNSGGPDADPCLVGWCDMHEDSTSGLCRDNDGLPIGLCDGVPSCAGDPCEVGCENGLSCIAGECAFACESAADCALGHTCRAGACFNEGGELATPCRF